MQKRWQVRPQKQRVIIVILLFVGLLMGSVALYFEDRTNGLLRQVHDPVMMIFIGASPERFPVVNYCGCSFGLATCCYRFLLVLVSRILISRDYIHI